MAEPIFFEGGPLNGIVWIPGGENRDESRVVIDGRELRYLTARRSTTFGERIFVYDNTREG
jgi:hypothetical protein